MVKRFMRHIFYVSINWTLWLNYWFYDHTNFSQVFLECLPERKDEWITKTAKLRNDYAMFKNNVRYFHILSIKILNNSNRSF